MNNPSTTEDDSFRAGRCAEGHLTVPPRPACPHCSKPQTDAVDLQDRRGRVLTWTEVTATPPGVREPNTLAVVEFEVDGSSVRAIGQTAGKVAIGDTVQPVPVDQLRDPKVAFRDERRQRWDGVRFESVD